MSEPAAPPGRGDAPRPVLTVEGLTIQVATPDGAKTVVENLGFTLNRGGRRCALRANPARASR